LYGRLVNRVAGRRPARRSDWQTSTVGRARLRELGRTIGTLPTGPWNAITDVTGIRVGHATVVRDRPTVARTGVTIVAPRPDDERHDLCYAGIHSFNGNGEMTGAHWLAESGLLSGPIGITSTHQVGLVRDELVAREIADDPEATWCLPVVGETWDGWLSDLHSFPLVAADVRAAIDDLSDGSVTEGCVGGGTGMICHEFKGGIGTSSRAVDGWTVGVLVQANYGRRDLLRLDGDPIGRRIGTDVVPSPWDEPDLPSSIGDDTGSIIVVIATDAPLLADQCVRLAKRATVGLARVGGTGANSSGDIFLAFSTANRVPLRAADPVTVRTLPADRLSALFVAVAEAVEESIWNALCVAETTQGQRGRIAHAVPHDLLVAAPR
jgi:D-aminopeptidase